MTTSRTFKIAMTSSGPNGDSRVVTTMQAGDALEALQDAITSLATPGQPEEIAITIRLAPVDEIAEVSAS